tara:strand:+ start:1005 stop:1343 length:339 start_codon:yes stop_codon:yes gene_type:complete
MTVLIPLLDRDIQLHQVQAGETLSKIIVRYHGNLQADVLQSLISETMAANPQIKNPDLIYSGQLLQIPIPASYVSTETWSYTKRSATKLSWPRLQRLEQSNSARAFYDAKLD